MYDLLLYIFINMIILYQKLVLLFLQHVILDHYNLKYYELCWELEKLSSLWISKSTVYKNILAHV